MTTDNPYEINDLEAQLLQEQKPAKGLKQFFDKKKKENRDKKQKRKETIMEKKADQSISKQLVIKKANKDIITKTMDDF